MRNKIYLGLIALLALAAWFDRPNRDDVAEPAPASDNAESAGAAPFRIHTPPSPAAPDWKTELPDSAGDLDPADRTARFEQLAAAMSGGQRIDALTELMSADAGGASAEFRSLLIRKWAKVNPAEAAAWLAQWPDNAVTREAFSQVATVWAGTDLSKAAEWAESLPAGGTKTAALTALGFEAARTELSVALAMAAQLPPGTERDGLLSHVVRQWASAEPDDAMQWILQMPDSDARQRLVSDTAIQWAERDPGAAASAAINTLPAGENLDRCIVGIIQRWAQQSPEEAAQWVAAFPEIPVRDAAVRSLITQWAHADPRLPADWLSHLPPGSLRDAGVAGYADVLGPRAPGTALEWINTITGSSQREESLEALRRLGP